MKKTKLQDLMLFAVLGSLLLSQVSCAKKQAVVNEVMHPVHRPA